MTRKLAAGNWKMNGTAADLDRIARLAAAHPEPACEVLICPPATLISRAAEQAAGTPVKIGGQDCHPETSGAHTGDHSAVMLADAGATAVILGHSERRADHGETNLTVQRKAEAVLAADLTAIVCIGETLDQREAGRTLDIVEEQLFGSLPEAATAENTVVAYEPVWAIGTGKVPTNDQIAEVHSHIRTRLGDHYGAAAGTGIRLLYGGSVKPGNAGELFAIDNVDGALVGGASLRVEDFSPIISALDGKA
jgi:triosephosphate isomerase